LSLYQTNLDNANRDLATSKANLATAQSQFDAANKALADATDR
jgi:multidrug resistance efflux pump